jgi:hypothetical protein
MEENKCYILFNKMCLITTILMLFGVLAVLIFIILNYTNCVILEYLIPMPIYLVISILLHFMYLVMIFHNVCNIDVYNRSFINYFKCWFWMQIIGRILLFGIGLTIAFTTNFDYVDQCYLKIRNIFFADWIIHSLLIIFICYMFKLYKRMYIHINSNNYFDDNDIYINDCCW